MWFGLRKPAWVSISRERAAVPTYRCPCCRALTLHGRGGFEICPVCWWEDDDVQGRDPQYAGGANAVSLHQARENFRRFGAAEARFSSNVRRPTLEEVPQRSYP